MASGTALISEFYQGRVRLRMIANRVWLFLLMVILFIPATSPLHSEETTKDIKHVSSKVKDIYAIAAFSMIMFSAGIIYLPAHLYALRISEAETDYFLAFISLVAVASAAIMPKITVFLHEHGSLILTFALYGIAHFIFANADTMPAFITGGTFMGSSFGISIPLVNHMMIERSPPAIRGRNLAYLSMALFFGQFVTSFFEFIPDSSASIFSFAACFSIIVTMFFSRLLFIRRSTSV